MTLDEIKKEVRRMDPNVDGASFKAAVVLLSALEVGANAAKVAEFTGYPLRTCRAFSGRLKECGVWKGGKTHCEWFDKKHGGIAFWMDVAVAQGLLRRAKGASTSTRSDS